jgi:hypothetical protein
MKSLTPGRRAWLGLIALAVVSSMNAIPIGLAELNLRDRPRLEARAGKCTKSTDVSLANSKAKRQPGRSAAKTSWLFRLFL